MMDTTESKRKLPAGELTPAPIQGNGPAWEGKPLSDRVVEYRAVAGCQDSAKFSDELAKSWPPGAEASRDPTSSVEVPNEGLDPRGVPSPPSSLAEDTSTGLVVHTIQNAGDEGGTTTLPGPPETSCMAEVDGSTAPAQSAEEGNATLCGGLEHTNCHDVEQRVNPAHATPEQNLGQGQGSLAGFQELLQKAMRQSDAERAQDRESARNFRRARHPSPLEQKQGQVDQPIISTPEEKQLQTKIVCRGSDGDEAESIPADCGRIADDVAVQSTDSSPSSSALAPTPPPDVVKPVAFERQLVRYLSPEGYPYLYDEVTGESEWVVSDEEDAQWPQIEDPTRDTTSGAMQGEPGDTCHAFGEQDGHNDPLGTACIEAGERSTTSYPAEGESVGTCEVSQWSQDTSGPDARNSAGETAMHLAAAQHSPRGISLLLENGASVNARDHRGRTPLHAVCESRHNSGHGGPDSDLALLECTELLLSSGALEDARDATGQTALHLSALAGNLSTARALLAAGATVAADDAGNSPLHLAAAQGHSDIIQLLVVGSRDEPPRTRNISTPASEFSEVEARVQSQPPAAVEEVQAVVDEDASAHERGPGAVSARQRERASTTANGDAFGDDHIAARAPMASGQHFGDTDNLSQNVPGEPTDGNISSRAARSRYTTQGATSLEDGPTAAVVNGRSWSGHSPLTSAPNAQNHHLGQRGGNENVRPRWNGHTDSDNGSLDNSIRNAGRISEDVAGGRGHRDRAAVEAEHRRQRPRGIRLSRRRHESGRDDRTLGWPEALSSNEYEQIVGAAFAGEGDSGSRALSRSTLSAALFAACLASQSSDATALLHLLKMHGDGVGDVRDENGRTPLHHVCRADDVGLVRLLCQAGVDAAAQDCRGNSPLMVAAATGSSACLQLLVQKGSDLNCSNDAGDTPLHVAVRHGNLSCVKALVEGGAWLSQRNMQGFTPSEDLLNAKPMFTRGRLPKVLRATLEYIELAEASAAQPNSPTWTARDGYGSEATAVSAASRRSLADTHHHHQHHHRRDCFGQASSRRGGQSVTTGSGRAALPGQRRHVKGSTRTPITERRESEQEWEPRDLQGGGDVFDGRSEGGPSSGGGMRGAGGRNTREQTERQANTYTERESRETSEEEPPVGSGVPSNLRTGVWSVVGRAIDSLLGGGHGSGDGARNRSASEAQSDGSEQEILEQRRPPTDAELRARMRAAGAPSSKAGSKRTSEAGRFVGGIGPSQAGSAPETGAPSTTTKGEVAVKVPISLTPMQPPPDVLAAMKGRAALGRRRPRFSAPPDDVAAALEKTREAKNHGHTNVVDHGAVHDQDGNSETVYISYLDGRTQNQQPQQHRDTGVQQELGPFSMSASGGLGKQGDRSPRSMYIDYFDERKRMHMRTGDYDV